MKLKFQQKIFFKTLFLIFFYSTLSAGEVEVLHWWTSGGEAKAVKELKIKLEEKGHIWRDFAVAGGAGEAATIRLKQRVFNNDSPAAAQVKGTAIKEWAEEGVLTNLNAVAAKNKWDKVIPGVIQKIVKFKGIYVAVPVNVHQVNLMWINSKIFSRLNLRVPENWKEFRLVAEKIKKAGYIPIAIGGQNWQLVTIFESIVLGLGGSDLYRKAFIEFDRKALTGTRMREAFEVLSMIKMYTDSGAIGRDWDKATAMLIKDQAAIHFMGDWAKGEFLSAGQFYQKDFLCFPVPQTEGNYIFNVDSFVMFKLKDMTTQKAQKDFAELILNKKIQEKFNLYKGSIPVRTDMLDDEFDYCSKNSIQAFIESSKKNTLLPSVAHGMAVSNKTQNAIFDTITRFYQNEMTTGLAVEQLANAIIGSI